MGLKEFRDADPDNFALIYKLDPDLAKLPIENIEWFLEMPKKTYQYDLTAYLFARDVIGLAHPLYSLIESHPLIFEIGRDSNGLSLD